MLGLVFSIALFHKGISIFSTSSRCVFTFPLTIIIFILLSERVHNIDQFLYRFRKILLRKHCAKVKAVLDLQNFCSYINRKNKLDSRRHII